MNLTWLYPSDYAAAFLVGMLGGVHCLNMCGGIVSALSFSQARASSPSTPRSRFPILLGYNLGRISSYTLMGALAGGLGAGALSLAGLQQAQQLLGLIAAGFMIVLGLYLAGIWQGAAYLEKAGSRLWKHIEPLGRRFMPVQTPWQALPFGMIWGWLPCGLVYSVLFWSLAAGSWLKGGLLMLAFGLGTLPNLLLISSAASHLLHWIRHPRVRQIAGLLTVLVGLSMLWRIWASH